MPSFKWNNRELEVYRSEYQYGSCKQLAILCFDNTDPECNVASGIPYGVLTVNLDDPWCEPKENDEHGYQYLDINNWPGIQWILDHDADADWAEPTDVEAKSGFVTYPIWKFDLDKIPHI